MLLNYWPILIVDDDPDILQITKMSLKKYSYLGIPGKVFTYNNKADAIDFMKNQTMQYGSNVSVAIIDVVMETDEAGLELCNLIRGDMNNSFTQLYIRTGQAAKYTEKDILERFEVDGYLNKAEVTQERILKTVMDGNLEWVIRTTAHGHYTILALMIEAAGSRKTLREFLSIVLRNCNRDMHGNITKNSHTNWALLHQDEMFGGGVFEEDPGLIRKVYEQLSPQKPILERDTGARVVKDGEYYLFHLPADENYDEYSWVTKTKVEAVPELLRILSGAMVSYRNLWKRTPE